MSSHSIKNIVRKSFLYRVYRNYLLMQDLTNWSIHDREMLEFYSQFVSSGKLCFDVGANIGNRVKILLALGASVVAVEPQEECVQILKKVFGKKQQLSIIPSALGEREGEAEIMISNSNTLSSMSTEWVQAVKDSGRFSEYVWEKKQKIHLTTLDSLIERYGTPDFIKIDVEGFEYQVLRGLSQSVPLISLEFVPERIEPTLKCIDYLANLGEIRLNHSFGESMQFSLESWVEPEEMKKLLSNISGKHDLFGDVYIKSR
jgi:FkbM family methyltransferase